MVKSEAVLVLSLDEYGKLINATLNGEEGTRCDGPPKEEGRVIWSFGTDPKNGDGIEFLEFSTMRCIHHFCNWYCF